MSFGNKEFEVISLEWSYGKKPFDGDWSQASIVKAYNHVEAAANWAESDDQQGEYSIIRKGSHGPVLVRLVGDDAYKIFNISAHSEPQYFATEVI